MDKKKAVFMGTPAIAAGVLESLYQNENIEVVLAVTQPDRKQGRKQKLVFPEVKTLALSHDTPVFQPEKIRNDYQPVLDAKPDIIITCAYGQIVPNEILEAPVYGCINLHGSLLPKYRGAAPIQRALWDGEKVSGMSLMKMAEKMDAGPVLDMDLIDIEPTDTSATLFEKMMHSACRLLEKNLPVIFLNKAEYKEQDENLATYASMISKADEKLDLDADDERIERQIRALSPQPGAYILIGNKKLKILEAEYLPGQFGECFSLVSLKKNELGLQLKNGLLAFKRVQMEGKPEMDIKSFMNGQGKNLAGTRIEA